MEVMSAIQKQNSAIQTSVGSLEEIKPLVVELASWKPAMDKAVTELHEEMGDLRQQVERIARNPVLSVKPSELPALLPTPTRPRDTAPKEEEVSPSVGGEGHGPLGHRVASIPRGKACGKESSPSSLPAKGTCSNQLPHRFSLEFGEGSNRGFTAGFHGGNARVDCPQFDGENPRAWKMKCETYFRVSGICSEVWVGVAALQFSGGGRALTWLQSTNAHVEFMDWSEFSELVCAKFGRDEFQGLVRQFNRLKQTCSVLSLVMRRGLMS